MDMFSRQRGEIHYYNIINDLSGMAFELHKEENKYLVEILMVTDFHLYNEITFEDHGTMDGTEYIVESLIDGRYRCVTYNNPDNAATRDCPVNSTNYGYHTK